MKTLASILFLFGMISPRVEANVVYTFSDSPAGVLLSYSGSLDTSGLSNQGGLTDLARSIYISGVDGPGIIGPVLYEFENFQPSSLFPGQPGISTRYRSDNISFSWNMTTANQNYTASSSYGDTFGFYVFRYVNAYTVYLNPPFQYTSGAAINGGVTFAGQTLSSMGLTAGESFQIFLPGNQTVSGIVVVPEPQSISFLALMVFGIFASCRRHSTTAVRKGASRLT